LAPDSGIASLKSDIVHKKREHKDRGSGGASLPNDGLSAKRVSEVRQFHETRRAVSDVINGRIPHRNAFSCDGAERLYSRAIVPSRVWELRPNNGLQCPMQNAILLLRELVADHFFFGPRRLCSTWPTAFFSPRV
jgi:hypothetical protein